jgi:hypothetical protein
MPRQIEISDQTANVLERLGGTFDTPDDVIQGLIEETGRSIKGAEKDWDRSSFKSYFSRSQSNNPRQRIFLETLLSSGDENGWVPKDLIEDETRSSGREVKSHSLDGVQSSMTRRCQSQNREKFWERQRNESGDGWEYRIKPEYQDVATSAWNDAKEVA